MFVPTIKLELDGDAYARLSERAVSERRPIVWQAEVLLRAALGMPIRTDAGSGRSETAGPTGPVAEPPA
jgi:hypothetical protein